MGAVALVVSTRGDGEAEFQETEEDRQGPDQEKCRYAARSTQQFSWPLLLLVTVSRQRNPATGSSEKP